MPGAQRTPSGLHGVSQRIAMATLGTHSRGLGGEVQAVLKGILADGNLASLLSSSKIRYSNHISDDRISLTHHRGADADASAPAHQTGPIYGSDSYERWDRQV